MVTKVWGAGLAPLITIFTTHTTLVWCYYFQILGDKIAGISIRQDEKTLSDDEVDNSDRLPEPQGAAVSQLGMIALPSTSPHSLHVFTSQQARVKEKVVFPLKCHNETNKECSLQNIQNHPIWTYLPDLRR